MSVAEGVDRSVGSDAGAPAVGATDGRLLRSERTRQAIVDAFLDLIREGMLRPSSAQIAEKAGVTQRTLFNQFGDMDNLLEAVTRRHIDRVSHLIPAVIAGTLEERVAHFSDQLTQLLDEVMNIRWAVLTAPDGIKRFTEGAELLTTVLRHQLSAAFDLELAMLPAADRAEVIDVLEIEIDPLTWRLRRLQQRKSRDEARALVERAILLVLRGTTV